MIATLEDLDEAALMQILTVPKNALVKQYQRLFEMEDVRLTITQDALKAIARKAIDRKTGARGLRSIMEAILLDTMFELPGLKGVEEVVIGPEIVEGGARPLAHLLRPCRREGLERLRLGFVGWFERPCAAAEGRSLDPARVVPIFSSSQADGRRPWARTERGHLHSDLLEMRRSRACVAWMRRLQALACHTTLQRCGLTQRSQIKRVCEPRRNARVPPQSGANLGRSDLSGIPQAGKAWYAK